jgi:hypothetical protein
METAGGGWTMVARSVTGWTGTFSAVAATWNISDTNAAYNIVFSEINYTRHMLASYDSWKNIVLNTVVDSTDATYSVVTPYTLGQGWITGGDPLDGYNAEQWMLFVK